MIVVCIVKAVLHKVIELRFRIDRKTIYFGSFEYVHVPGYCAAKFVHNLEDVSGRIQIIQQ